MGSYWKNARGSPSRKGNVSTEATKLPKWGRKKLGTCGRRPSRRKAREVSALCALWTKPDTEGGYKMSPRKKKKKTSLEGGRLQR